MIRLEACKKCNGRRIIDVVKKNQNIVYHSKELCEECINGLVEVEVERLTEAEEEVKDEVKTEVKHDEMIVKRKYVKKR